MTFNLTKKRVGDCIDVTDFVANGSFASLKANVQYLDNASPDKFAVLVRTLDFNRNWNGDYVWVDKEAYHFLKKSSLIQGDLVLCNVGSVGIVFEVPDLGLPMTLGPNSVLCRTKDKDVIRQRFIYYFFLSSVGQALLEELSGGSTVQPKFNKTVLRNSEIDVPDLAHQDFIVRILGILDSKISTNAAISKTLESIAQTIFKSWFIDFEPVKAKMVGEKPAGMDAATAALFPDSMEESELGLIPKGWEIAPIGNVLDVGGGTTPSTTNSTYWDGEHCWTTPKDLSSQIGIITTSSTRKITDLGLAQISSGLLPINSVLMSCRAPIGYVSINAVPTAVNQGFITMKHSAGFHPLYVLNWINANMQEILNRAGGATFAEITRKAFREIPFLKPANTLMKKYAELTEPLLKELEQLSRQTENLQVVRDLLLPRLISGELQIPDEMLAS